jgi:hypothetical protein
VPTQTVDSDAPNAKSGDPHRLKAALSRNFTVQDLNTLRCCLEISLYKTWTQYGADVEISLYKIWTPYGADVEISLYKIWTPYGADAEISL